MVNVFDYLDYRLFLNDYYQAKKREDAKYSYRYFAKKAGIKGQSFLDMVIKGKRNLAYATINKFVQALSLKKKEARYFSALIRFNQAKNDDEKNIYFEQLIKAKTRKGFLEIDKKRYLYFTSKHLIIIREMVSLPHFREDPEWISQTLHHSITPQGVKNAIALLIKMDLLARNGQGKLILAQGAVTAQPDFESLEALQYYREVFSDAKEAIINIPYNRREAKSLTIPMPVKLIPKVKEKLQEFLEDIAVLVNNEADSFDDVYQLNALFYPVTDSKEKKP